MTLTSTLTFPVQDVLDTADVEVAGDTAPASHAAELR